MNQLFFSEIATGGIGLGIAAERHIWGDPVLGASCAAWIKFMQR